MDIVTGISAVSEALKLTKELRNIDKQLDMAELKLRLADLVDRLLETKEALQDAKQDRSDLEDEVRLLKKKLADRGRHSDRDGLLFELGDDGKELGEPFCNHCFIKEDKFYRLIRRPSDSGPYLRCLNCNWAY